MAANAMTELLELTHVGRAVLLAGAMLLSPPADAAEVAAPPGWVMLDEIEVTAKRRRLTELRQDLTRLENQIYTRYNHLNKVDRFDVVCSEDARTGTRLTLRHCRPKFEDQARAEEGQIAFRSLQQIHDPSASVPPASVELPDSPVPKIMRQVPAFQRHMRQIVEKDPQLQQLLQERAATAEEIERTRREVFAASSGEP
jgi:hypothetical protein